MATIYYYAPCYEGPTPSEWDDSTDPPTEYPGVTVKEPGQDPGSGVEFLAVKPMGMAILCYDALAMRCVVKMPHTSSPAAGWEQKSPAAVLADYPDLPGVEV